VAETSVVSLVPQQPDVRDSRLFDVQDLPGKVEGGMALSLPKYHTTQQVGEMLNLSSGAVRSLFGDEPDVIRIGHPGLRAGKKRRYVTLRIPETAIERVVRRLTRVA
jgi:hypothetical protein